MARYKCKMFNECLCEFSSQEELKKHESMCLFMKVYCNHCRAVMPRILLPTHELTVCEAVIKCRKCHTLTGDKNSGYQSHHDCIETLKATISMLGRNKEYILSACH